ncbi:hypothetical protein OH768_32780 [Streptomyces sp. NBC_01622]|uniref:hypothetical protein n=1 Tax=Streptomyces sp. NBC_01622 TaxID=2975903 RepID=UPI0038645F20|nr:hypothetical protein OH768_32780 [Streptomyces sp. NBC_01622]
MFFFVLVLLALVVGGAVAYGKRQAGGGSSRSGAGSAQQVYDADAGAEATRWVERLGGSLSTLDADGNTAARQALADAAERHRAAEGQLATAYSPMQYGLVTQTAIEGLHHIRTARGALGLDPGPELPAQGTGGQVTVGGQTYTASARPGANTPYYYPGGVVNGLSMAGGWYSTHGGRRPSSRAPRESAACCSRTRSSTASTITGRAEGCSAGWTGGACRVGDADQLSLVAEIFLGVQAPPVGPLDQDEGGALRSVVVPGIRVVAT